MTIRNSDFLVRINGVLPELSEVGSPDFSKRAAEIYQTKFKVNTSCSLFGHKKQTEDDGRYFHLLVDIGEGVVDSLQRGHTQVYGVEPDRNLSGHNSDNNGDY